MSAKSNLVLYLKTLSVIINKHSPRMQHDGTIGKSWSTDLRYAGS